MAARTNVVDLFPRATLTLNQKLMMADLYVAGAAGLYPTEAGEVSTANALVRKKLACWRGMYLHLLPAGRAYIAAREL